MSVIPVVRHLIACKKPPTMEGGDPSVHQILHAIRPKAPFAYPIWMPPFYLFAMLADGQGVCGFGVEMRMVRLDEDRREEELLVGRSNTWRVDLGQQPLRVQSLSFMMPPVLLPEAGVYRLYLISNGVEIGSETFHAR
jgi:hypothetical protein